MSLQRCFVLDGETHADVEMFGGAVAVDGQLQAAAGNSSILKTALQNPGPDAETLMAAENGEVDEPCSSIRPIDEYASDAFAGIGDEDAVFGEGVLLRMGVRAELELRFEHGLNLLLVQTGSEEDPRPLFHEEAEQQGLIEVGGRLESNGLWQFWCHRFMN
jgi:hypothetical protein